MPAKSTAQGTTDRRGFLRSLSVGVAALAFFTLPVRAIFAKPSATDVPDFPEDSLYRPRPDQLEAMQRGQRLPTKGG